MESNSLPFNERDIVAMRNYSKDLRDLTQASAFTSTGSDVDGDSLQCKSLMCTGGIQQLLNKKTIHSDNDLSFWMSKEAQEQTESENSELILSSIDLPVS